MDAIWAEVASMIRHDVQHDPHVWKAQHVGVIAPHELIMLGACTCIQGQPLLFN
jgi:hypothetical protein